MTEEAAPNVWPHSYALSMTCVPLPDGDRAPAAVAVLPFGALAVFAGALEFGAIFVRDAGSVIAATYEHMRLFATAGVFVSFPYVAESDHEFVPAAGRFIEFEPRTDGIWGRVAWSDRGLAHYPIRRFANLGVIVAHKIDGEIERIIGAVLMPPGQHDRRVFNPVSPQPHGVCT